MKSVVNVGASSYTGEFLLPQLIADWEKQNPDTELKLNISDSSEIFEQVLNGDVELGVIGMSLENDQVKAETFLNNFDELILICPPDHPFANRGEISVEDLKNQDFIFREPGSATRMWYREVLARHGITPENLNIVAELDTYPAIIRAVESGSGISFVLKKAAMDSIKAGRVKEVKIKEISPLMGNLYVIYNTDLPMSDEARRFLTFLGAEKQKLMAA
ncbi:MAG: LysR substrate-binding domain-containing protein [Actinomycetota bacterium]|nr:LysR substrate-binding domain-containing protein [Actinomycetota bacterium]